MKVHNKIVQLFFYIHLGGSVAINMTGNQFPMRTDYKYDEQAAAWIKWHAVPATWHEARLRCYYEGAVLASPINKNLHQAMVKMLEEKSNEVIFTGIHSTFSKGDFTSIEGWDKTSLGCFSTRDVCEDVKAKVRNYVTVSTDAKLWSGASVPLHELFLDPRSNRFDGKCLAIHNQGYVQGSDCSAELPYMCYMKMAPKDLRISMCGTVDQEYEYSPQTGSCYKFHRIGRTWSRAFMTCLGEGGHLAIINSDLEAQVIREIFNKHPEKTIMASYTHTASIGFQNWGQRGSWWTIHGQDLSQAGYEKWDQGSPDGSSTRQFCGSVNRSGKLNDIWCDDEERTFPAICEISPAQEQPIN